MKKYYKAVYLTVFLAGGLLSCNSGPETETYSGAGREWRHYQGGPDRNQYSRLDQINTANVQKLQMVWQFHTGAKGEMQTNPLIVDGMLFGMTATTQPFALDAATGKLIWRIASEGMNGYGTSRGLSFWEDGDDKRILYTNGSWLYAVESTTGNPIEDLGDGGRVSLKKGLGETSQDRMVISTTPGAIYKDIIIMPLRVSEGADAARGLIQAFDIRT